MSGTYRWAIVGGVLAVMAAGAQAQDVPATSITPTREEIDPSLLAPTTPAPARLHIEGDIERAPCALADPAYAGISLTLNDATFSNLGEVAAAELRPAFEPYIGKTVGIATICEIRDAAATILRRKGYLAAVQVPVQRIEDGIVRFEVMFAKVVAVRVRGDAGRAEGLLAGYLNKLTDDPVFNRYAAERYLLLARDLPGYDIRLSLRPAGTGPGELVGEVTVVRTPVEIDFNVQNFASRDTGRWGGQLRAQIYGLTGLGDRTTIALYSTAQFSEQQVLQIGHEFRVGPEGLTLAGRFTYAWTDPDLGKNAPDLRARTLFATAEAAYPFVRTQNLNVRGALGMDYVNQRVRFNRNPLTEDKLRVAYLRIDADTIAAPPRGALQYEPSLRLAGSFELRRGLDIFGATEACRLGCVLAGGLPGSRLDGDPTATVMRFSGVAEARLVPGVTIAVLPRAQYAFDPLMSFEEFSAGSYTIGRGFEPGALIGDSGYGFTTELRLNRITPFGADVAMQPFAFVDTAWVWDRAIDGAGGHQPYRLTSVGGGVRASWQDHARLDLTLAVPTNRPGFAARRGDVRLLISLTTKLVPWSKR